MLEIGSVFDRYRIESPLGKGGMGTVYRALDMRLRRPVALKVLDRHPEEARPLLLREARAAAALLHPNIVTVFDIGESNGVAFITMELVEGVPLRRHIGTKVPMVQAIRWLMDVARGLAEAHRGGLVHRDVKPGNVMITPAGAKLLDFGIATPAPSATNAASTAPMGPLSAPGGLVYGTPKYMAPEQLYGGPTDARCDQFSWGLVAYELVSGRHARSEDTAGGLGWKAPPLDNVPSDLAAIILRALSTFPSQRYATMDEIAKALEPLAGPGAATLEFRAIQAESAMRTVKVESKGKDGNAERTAPLGDKVASASPRPSSPDLASSPSPKPDASSSVSPSSESFREPDCTFLKPLVDAALLDIKAAVGDKFRSAVVLVTVDVQGTKGRYFTQLLVVDSDDRIIVPQTSLPTLVATGEFIGADARAGNGRWRQVVIRLSPRGLDPRGEIEVS